MYGTVRTVVWEDGVRKNPSYPIAEHAPQLGGESPLPNRMEVKGGAARQGVIVRRGLKEAWSKAAT